MKGLVFALLVANILLFGWFSINRHHEPQLKADAWDSIGSEQAPTIVLLSEADKSQSSRLLPEQNHLIGSQGAEKDVIPGNSGSESKEAPEPKQLICITAAIFDAEEDAIQLQEQLKQASLVSHIRTEEIVDKTDYRVIIEPADTFEEAQKLSSALLAKGYENYIIASGSLRNGISLGLFQDQQRAHTLNSEVEKAGFEKLQIYETIKYKTNYAVNLEVDEADVDEKIKQIETMGLGKQASAPCTTYISPPPEE